MGVVAQLCVRAYDLRGVFVYARVRRTRLACAYCGFVRFTVYAVGVLEYLVVAFPRLGLLRGRHGFFVRLFYDRLLYRVDSFE